MARLSARLRRKMAVKKNRFKTSKQQSEDSEMKKQSVKKPAMKKRTTAKTKKRVYQKSKEG